MIIIKLKYNLFGLKTKIESIAEYMETISDHKLDFEAAEQAMASGVQALWICRRLTLKSAQNPLERFAATYWLRTSLVQEGRRQISRLRQGNISPKSGHNKFLLQDDLEFTGETSEAQRT